MPLPLPDWGGIRTSLSASPLRQTLWLAGILLCLLTFAEPAGAQDHPVRDSLRTDTTSAAPSAADSLRRQPPPRPDAPVPTRPAPDGGGAASPDAAAQEPVRFSARDSLVVTFEETGDEGDLYGDVKVNYGETELSAYRVRLLFEQDEMRAQGLVSDTGFVGRPYFKRGSDEAFYGDELAYNLSTQRGRVVGARTSFDEGFVRGNVVKMMEDSTLYVAGGTYSTCECETDPSYSLRSRKMKVQEDWVYTGPIQLYIFNIPMPLWLPFGFLPATEGRRSGPLPPDYGEDQGGFYLRDWGWYWAINDYYDLQVQGGIWSRGSWMVSPTFRYRKRYGYSGRFFLNYTRKRQGESTDPDFFVQSSTTIRWNHRQEINPYTNFSADVNLSSTDYLRFVSESYEDRYRQSISSSIQFDKRWEGTGRSFNASARQSQVVTTGEVSMTLPSVRFSQSSRKPFQREVRPPGQDEAWYERITYSYTSSMDNRYQFRPREDEDLLEEGDTLAAQASWYDALLDPDLYRRATGDDVPFNFQARHSVPVSAPFSITRLPLLNWRLPVSVSPSINYSEDWFLYTERRRLDEDSTVVTEDQPGFFALRQFNASVSTSTTFYGLFPIRLGSFRGVRHTVRPNLSLSYRPDFYADRWGYTRSFTDPSGKEVEYAIRREVPRGRSQNLSMSVSNVFETKRVHVDSTGAEKSRRLKLLDVNASTGYNMAADSFRLSPLNMSARTNLFDQVSVNFRSTFDPYALNDAGTRRTSRYVWQDGPALPRLTQASLSLSTSFKSERQGRRDPAGPRPDRRGIPPGEAPLDPDDPFSSLPYGTDAGYADFSIPWSISFDFSYRFTRRLTSSSRTLTLNSSFDFNLTPLWKIRGRTGYDFEQGEIAPTSLNIHRDLGCWEMSFNWVPFGRYESYGFNLRVKSGKLRDLLQISQPRSDVRGRFQGLVN